MFMTRQFRNHPHPLQEPSNPSNYDHHRVENYHPQDSPWPVRCNNCGNFAEIFCPRCENVGYCSEAHLLEDEMNHKAHCCPEQNFTEINRLPDSHEVIGVSSANNLKAGQTIAKIRPLMMAPHDKNLPGPPSSSLCFGCCKWFSTGSFQCSMCGWPVCSIHCETSSLHSTYECEVFHMENVPFTNFPGVFDVVLTLRCILMLENSTDDDAMCQAFRDWNSFKVTASNQKHLIPPPTSLLSVTEEFLIKVCRLNLNMAKSTLPDFIHQVVAFMLANSLQQENRVSVYDSNHVRNYYSAKYVMPHKFAYGQDCNPNVNWTVNYAPTLRETNIHLFASVHLKVGDKLTACFDQTFAQCGTHERRTLQMLYFQRQCECPRCRDPTELESFASAVKCRNCMRGYILPLNPLGDSSLWKCRNESCNQEFEPKWIFNKCYLFSEEIDDVRNCVGSLMVLIKKMEHSLHHQHYLIARAADRVVELGWLDIRSKTFQSLDLYFFKPFYKAARICLNFADAVSPGLTKYRAKYIFMLQMIHGIAESHNAIYHFGKDEFVEGRLIRQKFEKIYLYQQEFHKIAQYEKPGSCLYTWLETLEKSKDDLGELLRTTAQTRAFDAYELERLKRAFSYFTSEEYEPNLPQDLHVDVSHIVFYIDPKPFRVEYKNFFRI